MDLVLPVLFEELKWAWEHTLEEGSLAGLCAITSTRIFRRLREEGVEGLRLAVNDEHCFIIWDSAPQGSTILDVTASQFEEEGESLTDQGILICPLNQEGYWKASRTFRSANGLRRFLISEGWPKEQIPD